MSDNTESGWGTAALWYGLAIFFLIVAIIVTLWYAFRNCDDDDKKSDRRDYSQLIVCLWLAIIGFGVLALVQQNYDVRM